MADKLLFIVPGTDLAAIPGLYFYDVGTAPQTESLVDGTFEEYYCHDNGSHTQLDQSTPPLTSYAGFTGTQYVDSFGVSEPTTGTGTFSIQVTFRVTAASMLSSFLHIISFAQLQIQASLAGGQIVISGDTPSSFFQTLDVTVAAGDIMRVYTVGGDAAGDPFDVIVGVTPSGGGAEVLYDLPDAAQNDGVADIDTGLTIFAEPGGANIMSGDISEITIDIDDANVRTITGADLVAGGAGFTVTGTVAAVT